MYSICFIFSYLSNILNALAKQISGMLAPICNRFFRVINQLKRHKTCFVDAQTLSAAEYDRFYSRFYPNTDTSKFIENQTEMSDITAHWSNSEDYCRSSLPFDIEHAKNWPYRTW